MDGNAEGYLLYGFVAMHGVTCVRGGDSILIDISELADADSAYGMFSANRDPRLPGEAIGAGGQITPRRAIFVKDRFYAELAANPEKDHTPALRAFAAALERSCPAARALPAALAWFPAEGQKSVRLIPESVLGLRAAEARLRGRVRIRQGVRGAGIVARSRRGRDGETCAPASNRPGDPLQLTDRYLGRLCFLRQGRYIVGYANVAEGHDPVALATALAARLP